MSKSRRYFFMMLLTLVLVPFVATGCAGKKKRLKEQDRLAALQGKDIPLSDQNIEEWQFVESNDPIVFSDVYFDYNSSSIRKDAREQLGRIADWLEQRKHIALMVEGHCDERGSKEYNLALGEQRALAIRRFLVARGIDANRIYTVSYGEEKPLDLGHKEAAWAKNRRAHFLITQ